VTPTRKRAAAPDDGADERAGDRTAALARLGLERGESVRFRRRPDERWRNAKVDRRERDGSIGLHDGRGAARAIPVEMIEVRTTGPRGGLAWEPLADRAARTEQLRLL
jgi:hypothetical protein